MRQVLARWIRNRDVHLRGLAGRGLPNRSIGRIGWAISGEYWPGEGFALSGSPDIGSGPTRRILARPPVEP